MRARRDEHEKTCLVVDGKLVLEDLEGAPFVDGFGGFAVVSLARVHWASCTVPDAKTTPDHPSSLHFIRPLGPPALFVAADIWLRGGGKTKDGITLAKNEGVAMRCQHCISPDRLDILSVSSSTQCVPISRERHQSGTSQKRAVLPSKVSGVLGVNRTNDVVRPLVKRDDDGRVRRVCGLISGGCTSRSTCSSA